MVAAVGTVGAGIVLALGISTLRQARGRAATGRRGRRGKATGSSTALAICAGLLLAAAVALAINFLAALGG